MSAIFNAWRRLVCLAVVGGTTGSIALAAGQEFFPIQDVRPGLRGIGKTVFLGDRIEDFQVEILGVLQNFGPGQPVILARLSGGPLAETGILQGMSGSPVYIEGKLLGAVALGFPFSKEPIAGIQPIESMIKGATLQNTNVAAAQNGPPLAGLQASGFLSNRFNSLLQLLSSTAPNPHSPLGDLSNIPTPLSISGFTNQTVTTLDAPMRRFGLTAQQGVAFTGRSSPAVPNSAPFTGKLQPGSMISVGLITGDLNMTADGTVTYIDGDTIYAFGHRFLNIGSVQMPLAYSDVIACIPSTNTSFKLSAPRNWIGTITSDHATGIAGRLGKLANTVPLSIALTSGTSGTHTYNLQVVNDRLLTPFLTQTALFSTIDATERTIGTGTLKLQGEITFDGNFPPLLIRDLFVSDSGLAQQAAADAVVTLAFVLGGGFQDLHVQSIKFRLEELESKKQLRLSQAWTSAHEVHPGEKVDVTAVLQAENGTEVVKNVSYLVPVGAPTGPLNLTLSDANVLNFPDFAGIAQTQFKSARDMLAAVNRYRSSESLYIRVWRQQPAYNVAGPMPGGELTDPPPSVVLVLADTASSVSGGAASAARGSDVAQLTIPMPGFVVTGAKTIQIEVKD